MLGVSMYNTIQSLWKAGHNKLQITKLISHDWKTVNKVIKQYKKGIFSPQKNPHPSKLDNYLDQILELLEHDLSAVRIHEYLREQNIDVGYSTVKDYIKKINKSDNKNVCIRFVCEPGEESQVDFGYVGLQPNKNGKKSKCWIFAMNLSYSRLTYYEVVFDQKVSTFINCHVNAFKFFKGIPKRVKIDNLKAAILEANFYQPVYQEQYKNFADTFGFDILPCRVRQPQEKGRIESNIKYVKNNFFKGRIFNNYLELTNGLYNWQNNKCNTRIHGTTKKQPVTIYKEIELKLLTSLPQEEYKIVETSLRLVAKDCHITYDNNYYSVPYKNVGNTVQVEVEKNVLKIISISNGDVLAIHPILLGAGKFNTIDEHYPPYKQINSDKSRNKLQQKMISIGCNANKLFTVIIKDKPNSWYQFTNGIINLTKTYPNEVIDASCERAVYYNSLLLKTIKNCCQNGSYKLPLDKSMEVLS